MFKLFGQPFGHIRVDKPRCDGVYGDAFRAVLLRECPCQTDKTRFRRDVVGLSGVAVKRHHRRHIDDAAPFAREHPAQRGFGQDKGARQVRVHHGMPVAALETQGEAVSGDSSVVDQNVEATEVFLNCPDKLCAGIFL